MVFSLGLASRYLTDYCVPVSEVFPSSASMICHLLSVRRRQLSVPPSTCSLLEAVLFLSLDQQSGIHCLMICVIQLLTPNNFDKSYRLFYIIMLYKSTFT